MKSSTVSVARSEIWEGKISLTDKTKKGSRDDGHNYVVLYIYIRIFNFQGCIKNQDSKSEGCYFNLSNQTVSY